MKKREKLHFFFFIKEKIWLLLLRYPNLLCNLMTVSELFLILKLGKKQKSLCLFGIYAIWKTGGVVTPRGHSISILAKLKTDGFEKYKYIKLTFWVNFDRAPEVFQCCSSLLQHLMDWCRFGFNSEETMFGILAERISKHIEINVFFTFWEKII